MNSDLLSKLNAAVEAGDLLSDSLANITEFLESDNPVYEAAVSELAESGEWSELNNRFFKKITGSTPSEYRKSVL